jgi:hypothetical protein
VSLHEKGKLTNVEVYDIITHRSIGLRWPGTDEMMSVAVPSKGSFVVSCGLFFGESPTSRVLLRNQTAWVYLWVYPMNSLNNEAPRMAVPGLLPGHLTCGIFFKFRFVLSSTATTFPALTTNMYYYNRWYYRGGKESYLP